MSHAYANWIDPQIKVSTDGGKTFSRNRNVEQIAQALEYVLKGHAESKDGATSLLNVKPRQEAAKVVAALSPVKNQAAIMRLCYPKPNEAQTIPEVYTEEVYEVSIAAALSIAKGVVAIDSVMTPAEKESAAIAGKLPSVKTLQAFPAYGLGKKSGGRKSSNVHIDL
jgi:hypothetical protein